MSRNKANKSPDKGNGNNIAIAIAIIGLLGTFVTAYFGFRASVEPTAMIIGATKTAQVMSTESIVQPSSTAVIAVPSPTFIAPTLIVTYPADCMGYERVEDWNQAAECYKQKVIANPEDFSALSNVARVYGNGEQYDKMVGIAQEMMAVAHNSDEGAQAVLYLGAAYYNLGEYSSAINTLSMAESYSNTSSYFPILIWLARSYDAIGDKANACESYKTIVTVAQQTNSTGSISEYQSGVQRNCP